MHHRKQSCEIEFDADVLRRAMRVTRDLNGTIGSLLASYVEAEEAKRAVETLAIGRYVDWSNTLIEEHGSPADEHNPF